MGDLFSKSCRTCGRLIRDAGIFSGDINCDDCARAERIGYQCGCCKRIARPSYSCSIHGFFLCETCSDKVVSYIEAGNYHRLECMMMAIRFNGYSIPSVYEDEMERARRRRMIGQ